MNQKVIRIVALILAILMAGGVLIVAFSNIAVAADESTVAAEETSEEALDTAPILGAAALEEEEMAGAPAVAVLSAPATGTDGVPKAPVIIGIVAVLLAVGCVVVPKIAKK
ncbi:MAG TPA: hypothetical protein DDY98_07025 [Ruminococcaceae bacterium]|nr:hypothetical protein [Oscillospiraceae bacterium]